MENKKVHSIDVLIENTEKFMIVTNICKLFNLYLFNLLDYNRVILAKSYSLPTSQNNVMTLDGYDITDIAMVQETNEKMRDRLTKMVTQPDTYYKYTYNANINFEMLKF